MHPWRTRFPLDGIWKIQAESDLNAFVPEYVTPGFDDHAWREIPPATHIQPWLYPDNPYWGQAVRAINESAWWYRTRFQVADGTPQPGQRFRLLFEAVDYDAQVWLNGTRLGQHEGGFTPFAFDVTDLLRPDNVLAVRVTAPWDKPRRRSLTYADQVARGLVKGLYAHADGLIPADVNPIGIWRPVWLETHHEVTIERVPFSVVEDEFDRSAQVTLRVHIRNYRKNALENAVLHIYLAGETTTGIRVDQNFPLRVPAGDSVIEQRVRIGDPQWWWPWDMGHPDLYRVRCTLYDDEGNKLDVHEQVIGLRQVRLLRSKTSMHYQINKTPIFVRGVTYMGALYLSQLTPERIQADLAEIRACGLNLIRLHVHVAPPELYAACDRLGILVWQDFELNWLHDPSPAFETRAVRLLHEMVDRLENHCSIVTWCCHNEPNALPFQDRNLTEHPDPRLYRELRDRDPSRPLFISSGRNEADWMRGGDAHDYVGGGHGGHYLDVYGRKHRLVTEFGCEAPPTEATLNETPLLNKRLAHIRKNIVDLHRYQAELIKYQIEWYRRTRFEPCGGYIHFMWADLYPQVGCGVLDVYRRPRPGLAALKAASQPVHVMMEYNRTGPVALWVANDLLRPLINALIEWQVTDEQGQQVTRGSAQIDIPAQRTHRVHLLDWRLASEHRYHITLRLTHRGQLLDENHYEDPFHPAPRPPDFPWGFDPLLGMRCFGGPHAHSALKVLNTPLGRLARLLFPVYEWAERMLAQHGENPQPNPILKKLFG